MLARATGQQRLCLHAGAGGRALVELWEEVIARLMGLRVIGPQGWAGGTMLHLSRTLPPPGAPDLEALLMLPFLLAGTRHLPEASIIQAYP